MRRQNILLFEREEKRREESESNEGNKLGKSSLLSLDRALRFLHASLD